MSDNPEIIVNIESMSFSPIPLDNYNRVSWQVTVDWRGGDRFAVRRGPYCLSRSTGSWDYEHIPSERRDDWLADHRFSIDDAKAAAMRLCSSVAINGLTAAAVAEQFAVGGVHHDR